VPLAGQRAIEAVKYDPSLSALPASARAALDRVAADRAYALSRLALVDEAATPRPARPATSPAPGDARVDDAGAAF
jgi:hypothetical protein